jgi:predicted PurR-regulated permease PerM
LAAHQIAQGSDTFAQSLNRLQRDNGSRLARAIADRRRVPGCLVARQPQQPGHPGGMASRREIPKVSQPTSTLGGALLHRLFLFLITLIALFLVLRDGLWLADHALAIAGRMLGIPGERLVRKIADAIRATVNGTVAASIVKDAAIGIAYVLTGVPHPLLFAVLTMKLAMVPLGAWMALTTAVLVLLIEGGTWLGTAGLAGFGAAVLLIVEHLIQPILIGGAARIPFLLVLIGIGGMQSFGLLGLFLGPVIMAAHLTIWREWISAEN